MNVTIDQTINMIYPERATIRFHKSIICLVIFLFFNYKHSVDTAYTSFFEQTLINGIAEARQKLQPAKLGVGWGFSQANINRRAIDVDGKASIGLNPDGAVDRRIGIIRLESLDGCRKGTYRGCCGVSAS